MGRVHPDMDSADRYCMGRCTLLVLDVAEQCRPDRGCVMALLASNLKALLALPPSQDPRVMRAREETISVLVARLEALGEGF